jgi:hypothetical protein
MSSTGPRSIIAAGRFELLSVYYERIEKCICGRIVGLAVPTADSVHGTEEKQKIKWLFFKGTMKVPCSKNFGGYGNRSSLHETSLEALGPVRISS